MRWLVALSVMLALDSNALAQAVRPEVDSAEVLRRGNLVQVVGDGVRASPDDAYVEAMGPPASDADKWFISVLTQRGCAACEKLKRDWSANPWLLALANPSDPKQSWSHYTIFDKDDRSQAFRFEKIKVTAYPTVLVQPPRTGRYGEPGTVVFQSVYGGDAEKLARDITQTIRHYVTRLQSPPNSVATGETGQIGIDPPWQPVPKVDPWQPPPTPNQPFPQSDPTIPPQPAAPSAVGTFPWSAVLTLLFAGFSLPAAIALVIWVASLVRAHREAEGKPPLLDQETFDRVMGLLKQFAESQPKQPTKA